MLPEGEWNVGLETKTPQQHEQHMTRAHDTNVVDCATVSVPRSSGGHRGDTAVAVETFAIVPPSDSGHLRH